MKLERKEKWLTKNTAMERTIPNKPQATSISWNISPNLATSFSTQIQWHNKSWRPKNKKRKKTLWETRYKQTGPSNTKPLLIGAQTPDNPLLLRFWCLTTYESGMILSQQITEPTRSMLFVKATSTQNVNGFPSVIIRTSLLSQINFVSD